MFLNYAGGFSETVVELADFYLPDKAGAVWGESVAKGQARRDPALGPLDVIAHVTPLASTHEARVRLIEQVRALAN
jgi:hypothetical protein